MREAKKIDKLINNALEESNDFLEIYKSELNHYKKHLNYLENNKPLFFMKRSLVKYEQEKTDTIKNITRCQDKINEELIIIENLIKNQKNTK
ncbi:MAG: hypothetical protein IKN63_01430 [Bacilli bacterium]|nr:hypothetical protein [Bacilli bacterium]